MTEPLVKLRLRRPPPPGAPGVYFETYGCQMNVADSDLLLGLFEEAGYARAAEPAAAAVIVVNTCSVREHAEERVFARLAELRVHRRRRRGPGAVLCLVGCMAQSLRERVRERAPYVDVVAGPDTYRRLVEHVARARAGGADLTDVVLDRAETYADLLGVPGGDAVSGFVTVQRGCDKFCAFCVVPFARGRERSVAPEVVLAQARAFAAAGGKEITLLGQTVNSYRHGETSFAALLRRVARESGLRRVRFTSPYPVDFSDELIAVLAEEPGVARHVHLPLQSGSDAVLERMGRGYTRAELAALVARLRAAVPGLGLTTDLLVGFSGETAAEHAETLAAMRELDFDGAFTFAYSERPNTPASRRLPDDVPAEVKRARLEEVIALQEEISARRNAALVGRREPVLLHAPARRGGGDLLGRTSSFRAVVVPGDGLAPGDLVDVIIDRATPVTLFGHAARS